MQERAIKTKNRILKAARTLFAKHGYHGLSVDRIANRAKANKQRVYEYYKNKKTLFEACLVSAFEEVSAKEAELFESTEMEPETMTPTILRFYMRVHDEHPEFWRLLAWANLENEPFYKCLENINAETYERLRGPYERGRERGVFSGEGSFEAYMFALYAISYFYHSNQKTLASTLDAELFTDEGKERLVAQCAAMLVSK